MTIVEEIKGLGTIKQAIPAIKNNENLLDRLIKATNFLDNSYSVSARLYCLNNNITNTPLCSCKKPLKFFKYNKGFYKTCGDPECKSKTFKAAAIKANTNRDWVSTVKKMQATNLKRIGTVSNLSKDSASRKYATYKLKEKYGVDSPLKNKIILNKRNNTTLKRFNTLNMLSLEKVKHTIREKYDVEHPMHNDAIKEKSRINSAITKNKILYDRLKLMNLSIIQQNSNVFTLKCNTCNSKLTNIFKQTIHRSFLANESLCYKCNPVNRFRSKQENEISNYIKTIYKNEVQLNRKYLNGIEVDIIIPELKIGFEFNGLYWHSDIYKDRSYHLDKLRKINKLGYNLINIWEDDWYYKKDIIKSIIKSKLNLLETRIYARKCTIKEVDSKTSRNFLDTNHLQGNINAKYKIGLYYDNTLVSLMTFGTRNNNLELLRFANKLDTTVIGGASKLFKYFLKTYKSNKSIISYANRDHSNGNLYRQLGFNLIGETKPGYWWTDKKNKFNRINFQKHKLIKEGYDPSMSEDEIMYSRKFFKVYNTGNLKYEYKQQKRLEN